MLRSLLLASALLLSACSPTLIPGTPVRDTKDNREILDVFRRYREAFEARDAAAIAALASPRYLDARDGISLETLKTEMAQLFERVKDARLVTLEVRGIDAGKDRATVRYYFDVAFLPGTVGGDWTRESDQKKLELERTDSGWLVLSGF